MLKIFWNHPKLMDYRLRFFESMANRYTITFFFHEPSPLPHSLHCIYSTKEQVTSGITWRLSVADIARLFFGIKESDIFITSFLWNAYSILGLLFAKLLGKKVILWEELWFPFSGKKQRVKRLIIRMLAAGVDAFYVLGEVQSEFLQQLNVAHDKIFVANEYPGAIYSQITPQVLDLPFAPRTKIFLFIGRLVEFKGVTYLLQGFRQLAAEEKDVALLIVGDGPLKEELQGWCIREGLTNVHFCGWIADVQQKAYLFEASSCVVVPSITNAGDAEGGPLVVLEALSAGKPVIGTTALGSSTAFIKEGVNGYIVPEKDSQALYQAMKTVATLPAVDKEQILASFQQIRGSNYQCEQMEKAIHFVLAQHRQPLSLSQRNNIKTNKSIANE